MVKMIPHNESSELPVEEAEAEEVVAKLIWPQQDVQQLLENIHTHMPTNDTAKYSTTAKKLNWDDIKFGEYTADECKSQWDLVLTRIRRYRTLGEVVGDAKDWVKNPHNNVTNNKKARHPDLPKKPLSPFLRYFMEKRTRFAKKNPDSTSVVEMAKALAISYRGLSEKKKAKYKQAFDQEYEEYKVKMEEFKKLHPDVEIGNHVKGETKQNYPGPVRPKNPFQMYLYKKTKDRIDSKDPEDVDFSRKDNLEQIRKSWSNLSDKKRLKWIKKSIADEKRYNEELEEYKKGHPEFEPPVIKLLNKAEKDLKQRYDGKPEKPPCSGYALFSKTMLKNKTDCAAKDKIAAIAMEWKELSIDEKNKYNQKVTEQQKEYAEKMEVYLASLPADEREKFIAEEKYKSPSEKLKGRNRDTFGLKDARVEDLAKDPSVSTAAQCYYQAERLVTLQAKSMNKSQAELITQINDEWSKMPLEKKEKYFRMVENLTMPKKTNLKKNKMSERLEGLSTLEKETVKQLEKQLPRVPPKNPYSIFLTEKLAQLSNFEPKKRMAEVSRLWKSVLTPKEKQKYEVRVRELQAIHDKELQTFIKRLNSKERDLYDKYIKKPESSSTGKRKRNSGTKDVTTVKVTETSDDEKADSDEDDEVEDVAAEEEDDDDDDEEDDEEEDEEEDEDEDEEEDEDDDDSDEDSSDDENKAPAKKKSRS